MFNRISSDVILHCILPYVSFTELYHLQQQYPKEYQQRLEEPSVECYLVAIDHDDVDLFQHLLTRKYPEELIDHYDPNMFLANLIEMSRKSPKIFAEIRSFYEKRGQHNLVSLNQDSTEYNWTDDRWYDCEYQAPPPKNRDSQAYKLHEVRLQSTSNYRSFLEGIAKYKYQLRDASRSRDVFLNLVYFVEYHDYSVDIQLLKQKVSWSNRMLASELLLVFEEGNLVAVDLPTELLIDCLKEIAKDVSHPQIRFILEACFYRDDLTISSDVLGELLYLYPNRDTQEYLRELYSNYN